MRPILRFALSLFLTLAAAEMAGRLYGYFFVAPEKVWRWTNFAQDMNVDLFSGSIYPAKPDDIVGFVPQPGRHQGRDHSVVTIDKKFIRSNGQPQPQRPEILAVGDSFTYGDQVSDDQTWPAALERLMGRPVINAGVFGYGLDQTVLRAEMLIGRSVPDTLVVSFIPDDIDRSEMKVRTGVSKPYFSLDPKGQLVLHTPQESAQALEGNRAKAAAWLLSKTRDVLGYSYLVHEIAFRLFPESWLSNRFSLKAHGDGDAVTCKLLERLRLLPVKQMILLAQYPSHMVVAGKRGERTEKLLACGERLGFQIVDSFPGLKDMLQNHPLDFATLYMGHMSPAGNQWIAELLARSLRISGTEPKSAGD